MNGPQSRRLHPSSNLSAACGRFHSLTLHRTARTRGGPRLADWIDFQGKDCYLLTMPWFQAAKPTRVTGTGPQRVIGPFFFLPYPGSLVKHLCLKGGPGANPAIQFPQALRSITGNARGLTPRHGNPAANPARNSCCTACLVATGVPLPATAFPRRRPWMWPHQGCTLPRLHAGTTSKDGSKCGLAPISFHVLGLTTISALGLALSIA